MKTKIQTSIPSALLSDSFIKPTFNTERMAEYFGTVNYATNDRVLGVIRALVLKARHKEITLMVTSTGGPTGSAMSFYDTLHYVVHPRLVTVGSGDVDSSGVIIFLSGERRYVTKHTTMLLHSAGRCFDAAKRFTAAEVSAMVVEDTLKDSQYATLVAERSRGRLTTSDVLALMSANTVLSPKEIVSHGLADAVLE